MKRGAMWFLTGFIVAFVVLGEALATYRISDGVVTRMNLREFYQLEIPHAFDSHALGSESGNQDALPIIIFQHFFLSALAGFVLAGAVWLVRRSAFEK